MNQNLQATKASLQHIRLLQHLKNHSTGLNRYEADELLNIGDLTARISELKKIGHRFTIIFERATDFLGRPHKNVCRYFIQVELNSKDESNE